MTNDQEIQWPGEPGKLRRLEVYETDADGGSPRFVRYATAGDLREIGWSFTGHLADR